MVPQLELVTSPAYLAGLVGRSMADVRAMRRECQSIENGLSYVRRVAQGRIDIAVAALVQRRDGGDPKDLSGIIRRLPDILADRSRGAGPIRAPSDITVDRVADDLMAELDIICGSDIINQSQSELLVTRDALAAFEGRLSHSRRAVHDTLDALQAEITRRYRDGEVTVDSLLD